MDSMRKELLRFLSCQLGIIIRVVGDRPSNSFNIIDSPPSPAAKTVITEAISITIPGRVGNVLDLLVVIENKASMGVSFDALYAGKIPKISPIEADIKSAPKIIEMDYIKFQSRTEHTIAPISAPKIIPVSPSNRHSVIASITN